MKYANIRRCLVAAIVATGAVGVAAAPASAESCVIAHTAAAPDNRNPTYRATADRAEFEFPALMRALFDQVVFVTPENDGVTEGQAVFKMTVNRQGPDKLVAEKVEILWPLTAVKQGDEYYSVIGLSHDQNVYVGISLSKGFEELGSIPLSKGVFDPMRRTIDFNAEVSQLIHDTMMQQQGFSIRLRSGNTNYSAIQPETYAYVSFIMDKLMPAMDEARRQDAAGRCKAP